MRCLTRQAGIPYPVVVDADGVTLGSPGGILALALSETGVWKPLSTPGSLPGFFDGISLADRFKKDPFGLFSGNPFDGLGVSATGQRPRRASFDQSGRWVAYIGPSFFDEKACAGTPALRARSLVLEAPGPEKFQYAVACACDFLRHKMSVSDTIPFQPADTPTDVLTGIARLDGNVSRADLLASATLWSAGVFVIIGNVPATAYYASEGVWPVRLTNGGRVDVRSYYIASDFANYPDPVTAAMREGSVVVYGRGRAFGCSKSEGCQAPLAFEPFLQVGRGLTAKDLVDAVDNAPTLANHARGTFSIPFDADLHGLADWFASCRLGPGLRRINNGPVRPWSGLTDFNLLPEGVDG